MLKNSFLIATATILAALPAHAVQSCPNAKELETPFELTLVSKDGRKPVDLKLDYVDCSEEERDDLIPPSTLRIYKGTGDYSLSIRTSQGEQRSEVLVFLKDDKSFGLSTVIPNADLLSGNPQQVGIVIKIRDGRNNDEFEVSVRNAAKPL